MCPVRVVELLHSLVMRIPNTSSAQRNQRATPATRRAARSTSSAASAKSVRSSRSSIATTRTLNAQPNAFRPRPVRPSHHWPLECRIPTFRRRRGSKYSFCAGSPSERPYWCYTNRRNSPFGCRLENYQLGGWNLNGKFFLAIVHWWGRQSNTASGYRMRCYPEFTHRF